MPEVDFSRLVTIQQSIPGQELLRWLSELIDEDVAQLVATTDPEAVGEVGRLQGQIVRTQAILHVLGAEWKPNTGDSD